MSAYSGIYTDLGSLSQLRTQAERRPAAAIDEVATQFEALFTRMMLKTMRESSLGDSLFASNGEQQYLEMFDNQIAVSMSRGRGLGLKETLIRQLGGEPATAAVSSSAVLPRSGPAGGTADWAPQTAAEFVRDLAPHARRIAAELGVSDKAIIAQAALESGWGRHTMRHADGRNAFALFGIKADASWHGDRVSVSTLEFRDGIGQREQASFRAYDSLATAMNDYAAFISGNPRYASALAHGGDAHRYARELQQAGYATDPDYASKLGRIIDGAELGVAHVAHAAASSTKDRSYE